MEKYRIIDDYVNYQNQKLLEEKVQKATSTFVKMINRVCNKLLHFFRNWKAKYFPKMHYLQQKIHCSGLVNSNRP